MVTINGLIILMPFDKTKREPSVAPSAWPTNIIPPNAHNTFPPSAKKSNDAILVAKFSTLACAVALANPKPASETNAIAKKLPVPGPKKPSYKPTPKAAVTAKSVGVSTWCLSSSLTCFENKK